MLVVGPSQMKGVGPCDYEPMKNVRFSPLSRSQMEIRSTREKKQAEHRARMRHRKGGNQNAFDYGFVARNVCSIQVPSKISELINTSLVCIIVKLPMIAHQFTDCFPASNLRLLLWVKFGFQHAAGSASM